ncbi:MAG: diacylglycerol/lipid kinase family protein [Bacteriovoracaceae bacterium]
MQRIAVFYNSEASRAGKGIWIETIKKILFRSELSFIAIQNPDQIQTEVANAIKNNVEIIISIGGDGTVNLLIQALINTDIHYLVIPAGTANDLARELGLNRKIDKSIELIRKNQWKKIDLIKVNDRVMATNGGIGLGALLTDEINQLRKKYPRFKMVMRLLKNKTYDLFLALNILRPNLKFHDVRLKYNGLDEVYTTAMLVILNQEKIAGKIKVVEGSTNDDGIFDVVVFAHKNKASLSRCIAQVVLGKIPKNDPHFVTFQTRSLKIESINGEVLPFWGDGEVFEPKHTYEIEILPQVLKVYHMGKRK